MWQACELFYALKGGSIDYGLEHSAAHGHRRVRRSASAPMYPEWNAERPVLLLTHSQGANVARTLVRLLSQSAFPAHATSAAWVRGIVCIAAPMVGAPFLHSTLCGVPLPVEDAAAVASSDGKAPALDGASRCTAAERAGKPPTRMRQPVGHGLVGLGIRLGYVAHVLLGWSEWFRANVWDWRLEQWAVAGPSQLASLLAGTHELLHSTDTALHELTPAGAAALSDRTPAEAGVYYVSLPCCAVSDDVRLPPAPPSRDCDTPASRARTEPARQARAVSLPSRGELAEGAVASWGRHPARPFLARCQRWACRANGRRECRRPPDRHSTRCSPPSGTPSRPTRAARRPMASCPPASSRTRRGSRTS